MFRLQLSGFGQCLPGGALRRGWGGAWVEGLEQRILLTESTGYEAPVDYDQMYQDYATTGVLDSFYDEYVTTYSSSSTTDIDYSAAGTGYEDLASYYDEFSQQADEQSSTDVIDEAATTDNNEANNPTDTTQAATVPADPRLQWTAFVLPSGFGFQDDALPLESYLSDLLSYSPSSTNSFSSESESLSNPVITSTPGELGQGEKSEQLSTLISLSQTWISSTEWTVTQSRTRTFTSQESSTSDTGEGKNFGRTFTDVFSITITNGTSALVTHTVTDTFTFGVSVEWTTPAADTTGETTTGDVVPVAVLGFISGDNLPEETPVGNFDEGFFDFSSNQSASASSSLAISRITTADGAPATRYVFGTTLGASSSAAANGRSALGQQQGEMIERVVQSPLENGAGGTLPSASESANATTTASAGGNGASISLFSTVNGSFSGQANFTENRQLDVPDDNSLPTSVTGDVDYNEQLSDTFSDSLQLLLQFQKTSGQNTDDLSFTAGDSSGNDSSFDFSATATLAEELISDGQGRIAALLAEDPEAPPFSDSLVDAPDVNLEMSLEEDSSHTGNLRYRHYSVTDHLSDGIWTRFIDYHVSPTGNSYFDADLASNDAGDVILVLSTNDSTGFDMSEVDITLINNDFTLGRSFDSPELFRTQSIVRNVQENRAVTDTTALNVNLTTLAQTEAVASETEELPPLPPDSISISHSTTITASGSDVTVDNTVWHVWILPDIGVYEEGGTGTTDPVFLHNIPVVQTTSLAYTYVNDATSTRGVATRSYILNAQSLDDSGNFFTGIIRQSTMTDLVTKESVITENYSNFPEYVPTVAEDTWLTPGSYWYYLFNPSEMDDDLEAGFYTAGTVAVIAGSSAGLAVMATAAVGSTFTFSLPALATVVTAEGVVVTTVVAVPTTIAVADVAAVAGVVGLGTLYMMRPRESLSPLERELLDAQMELHGKRLMIEQFTGELEYLAEKGLWDLYNKVILELGATEQQAAILTAICRNLLYCITGKGL